MSSWLFYIKIPSVREFDRSEELCIQSRIRANNGMKLVDDHREALYEQRRGNIFFFIFDNLHQGFIHKSKIHFSIPPIATKNFLRLDNRQYFILINVVMWNTPLLYPYMCTTYLYIRWLYTKIIDFWNPIVSHQRINVKQCKK